MSGYTNKDESFLNKLAAIHQNPGHSLTRFSGPDLESVQVAPAAATGTQAPAVQTSNPTLNNG